MFNLCKISFFAQYLTNFVYPTFNKIDYLPSTLEDQLKIKPIYKTFQGWKTSTQGIKDFKNLPINAQKYLKEVEKFIGIKISSISTSPERNDTILIEDPFNF